MRNWVILPMLLTGCLHAQDRGFIQIPDSRKLALVIGNSEYPKAPLKNPVNDAAAMEATLQNLGFSVTTVRNADLRHMRDAIDDFAARLGPESLGFFYFAGHGVQVNSINYLLPVDFSAKSEDDIPYEAYPASRIQAKLEGSGARLRVMVLDACRNNPYRFKRDATEGLAAMSINAEGTLIAFATGDNNTAAENPAETNGLYTKFLIPALMTPGLNLRDAFQKAKEDVYRVSQRQQNPSVYENIVGQFSLLPGGAPRPATPSPDPARSDLAAQSWAAIQDSQDPLDFDNFIRMFPQSDQAVQAMLRGSQLRRGTVSGPRTGHQTVQTAPVPSAPAPGATKVNPKDGLIYAWIPPGTFIMGCSPGDSECDDREKPAKSVPISNGFWMGESEVTQAAYEKVTGENPSGIKGTDRPVETVNWNEAKSYCQAIGGRLPSEAEWEYAARAGTTGARYGVLDQIGWYDQISGNSTHPVKQKEPNAWGLYDMLGNVWEWVEDLSPGTQNRSLRGGSGFSLSRLARASYRYGAAPSGRSYGIGFRCAWE